MSCIKDLSNAIKDLSDLEKVGIFCFMVISIFLIISKINFAASFILYSFAIILLFLHFGLHKTKNTKFITPTPDTTQTIKEEIIGYDFGTVLVKKHPYNYLIKMSNFFTIIATIILIIDYLVLLKAN